MKKKELNCVMMELYKQAPAVFVVLNILSALCCGQLLLEDQPQTQKTIACENHMLMLRCPPDHVIRIHRANYGRFSPRVCNPQGNINLDLNCRSTDTAEIISIRCDGRNQCDLKVTSDLLGNNCPGTSKYAEVHHYCETQSKESTVPESVPHGPFIQQFVPIPERVQVCEHFMSRGSLYDLTWYMPQSDLKIIHFGLKFKVENITGENDINANMLGDEFYSFSFQPEEKYWSRRHQFALRAFSYDHGWGRYSQFVPAQYCNEDGPVKNPTTVPAVVVPPTITPSVYPKDGGGLRQACQPVVKLGVSWPETEPNLVRSVVCPGFSGQGQGVMHYKCLSSGIWDPNGPEARGCEKPDRTTTTEATTTTTAKKPVTKKPHVGMVKIVDYPSAVDHIMQNLTGSKNDSYDLAPTLPHLVHNLTQNVRNAKSPEEKKILANRYRESIMVITDELLKDGKAWSNMSHSQQRSTASSLLDSVERLGLLSASTLKVGSSSTVRKSNVVMKVLNVDVTKDEAVTLDASPNPGSSSRDNHFTIPSPVLRQFAQQNAVSVPVVFVVLSNLSEWLAPQSHNNTTTTTTANNVIRGSPHQEPPHRVVNSEIISVSLSEFPVRDLVEPVTFVMEHKQMESVDNAECSFWDANAGAWSSKGCSVFDTNKTHTTCRCNHLTSFAVLMDITGATMTLSGKVRLSLELITYIGCSISIICLLLSWITFACLKNLYCDRNTIHKHLVFCLMVAQILLVVGIQQTQIPTLCSVIAGFLHYFFLASFAWMCLEGIQLYIMLIEVFESERSRIIYYYLFGYGVPAIIVAISAGVFSGGYGTKFHCWLTIERGFIWSFVGPALAVMLLNVIMLGIAIYTMVRHSSMSHNLRQKSMLQKTRMWVKGAVVLVVLLGLTWVFGVLYLDNSYHTIIFSYFFTILNTLQGLFIFIFHCVLNEKVRKEYRRLIRHSRWVPDCLRDRHGRGSSSGSKENSSGNAVARFLRDKKRHSESGDSSANSAKPFLHKEQRGNSSSVPSSSDGVISSRLSSDNSNNNNRKASQSSSFHANCADNKFLRPLDVNGINGELSEVLDCSVVDSEFVSEYCQRNLQVQAEPKRYSTASDDSDDGKEDVRRGEVESSVDRLAALSVESLSKHDLRPVSHCDFSEEEENKNERLEDSDDGEAEDAATVTFCGLPEKGHGREDSSLQGVESDKVLDPEQQPLMMKQTDLEHDAIPSAANRPLDSECHDLPCRQSPSLKKTNQPDNEDKDASFAHTSVPCLILKPGMTHSTANTSRDADKDCVMTSLPDLTHSHTNGLSTLPCQNGAVPLVSVKRHSYDNHVHFSHARASSSDC